MCPGSAGADIILYINLYFRPLDPGDTGLLRALHSRNPKNIRNPLIFLQKMAPYSCFWRVPSSKILLQASLRRILDLWTLDHHINLDAIGTATTVRRPATAMERLLIAPSTSPNSSALAVPTAWALVPNARPFATG